MPGDAELPRREALTRLLDAAGFELRMRITAPDTHDATRVVTEGWLEKGGGEAFYQRERDRLARRG